MFPHAKIPNLRSVFLLGESSHSCYLSPYCVPFAVPSNLKASGVPQASCDQSRAEAVAPSQKNNFTKHGKQLLFSTIILQGQSPCGKQLFSPVLALDRVTLLDAHNSMERCLAHMGAALHQGWGITRAMAAFLTIVTILSIVTTRQRLLSVQADSFSVVFTVSAPSSLHRGIRA